MSSWPAPRAVGATPQPTLPASQLMDGKFYRFPVKCERAFLMKIEAAARKLDLSPQAFVQRHFETILDRAPEAADKAKAKATIDDIVAFAHDNQVSRTAARLWFAMEAEADAQGRLSYSRAQMLALLDLPTNSSGCLNRALEALKDAERLELLRAGNGALPSQWRVNRAGSGR